MSAIPECQILLICSDELVARNIRRAALLPQLVGAEAVKCVAIGIVVRVLVYRVRWYFDGDACGDVLAVGEGEAFKDFAVERGYGIQSVSYSWGKRRNSREKPRRGRTESGRVEAHDFFHVAV